MRRLTDYEKEVLAPFIPRVDLDNAGLHDGLVPKWLRKNYVAVTLENDIYIRPGIYDPSAIEGLAMLGHELVHVGQYRTGMTRLKYLWASRRGYRKNPYERPAYAREHDILATLKKARARNRTPVVRLI